MERFKVRHGGEVTEVQAVCYQLRNDVAHFYGGPDGLVTIEDVHRIELVWP